MDAPMYPLLPAGMMDPNHVDLRTFYPYTPNEVKHRKRTTSAQLKVLETVFNTDTKPNASLRQRLASQLEMTPRGVQVWFQNRRAKEKLKASKAAVVAANSGEPLSGSLDGNTSGDESNNETVADVDQASAPDSDAALSPVEPPQLPNAHLMALRRPSLPTAQHVDHLAPPANFDPMARRRSVDSNSLRYSSNPYARPGHLSRVPGRLGPYSSRAPSFHRPSMPLLSSVGMGHPYAAHGSLPDNSLYMATARPVPSPIPGPLPQPGFSFGAASSIVPPTSGDASERNSPDSLEQYSFPGERAPLPAFEEDESVYPAPSSRFGSFTSVASGDSAYFSDVGSAMYPPTGFNDSHRRDSSTSSHQFLGLMSNLDVNAESDDPARRFSLPNNALQFSAHNPGSMHHIDHYQFPHQQHQQQQQQTSSPESDQSLTPLQYSSQVDNSNSAGMASSGGSPPMNSSDGAFFYGSSATPASTPDSQSSFTQTTPDPGAALPNMTVPFDLPDFAHAPMGQQKFNGQQDILPPAIVSSGNCYDPVSFNPELAMPYHVAAPPSGASFPWC